MIEFYVIGAFLSVILFSIGAILVKYIIPEIDSPLHFLLLQLSLSLIVFALVFGIDATFHNPGLANVGGANLVYIVLASVFSFIGYYTYIAGLEIGKASLGGIFLSSRVFISVPLAVLIVGEQYPSLVYLFIIIALIGSITVSWEPGLSVGEILLFRAKGIRFFSLTAIFWSLGNFCIRQLGESVPLLTFLTIRSLLFVFMAISLYLLRFNTVPKFSRRQILLPQMIIYVILSIVAQLLFVYALSQSLGITETIGIFEGTLTFIFSVVFAKLVGNKTLEEILDSRGLMIRLLGVILAVIGTLGVSIIS